MAEYISREKVLEIVNEFDLENRFDSWNDYSEMHDIISELEAADVQSVKQGRWMCEFYNDVFDVYQADCSVCKRESTNKYDKVSESYEYCPHCGARMDGDTNG